MLIVNGADLTDIALDVKLVSPWNNGPASLTFAYPAAKAGLPARGSEVAFTYGGAKLFYGWLFAASMDRDKVSCTCYDQLRYLKTQDTILRPVEPLDAFVRRVCGIHGGRIRLGRLDSTEYRLKKYNFDNRTQLDMLYQSIRDNLRGNGYHYTLRDNFGALDLRDTVDLRLPLVIGDKSLATDFGYTVSIDDDTYNYVKVASDDPKKGVRNAYITQDGGKISEWGKLQYYEKVSGNYNDAQLAEMAALILAVKNRETESLRVEAMGDTRVMGGSGVRVMLSRAGLDAWMVVDSVTHTFSRSEHRMKLNLIFGRWY